MRQHPVTIVLATALAVSLATLATALRLPGDNQGYEPVQPIAFSHRLHVTDLRIGCTYCHVGAERSRHAGIPAINACMNCHELVTATKAAIEQETEAATRENRESRRIISAELRKLHEALGRDEQLSPIEGRMPKPIAWVKVHNLPDFVYFDHRPHVAAGVACQQCHGPVESMERIYQAAPLNMGWCVNCHREVNETGVNGKPVQASIDCASCHY